MTIREHIMGYQNEILKGNLLPQRAAEILTEIAALIGNINVQIMETEISYNLVLKRCFDSEKTANRAKIEAGTTQEFREMREARNTKELAIEMMRSLKYLLKAMEDEKGAAKYS